MPAIDLLTNYSAPIHSTPATPFILSRQASAPVTNYTDKLNFSKEELAKITSSPPEIIQTLNKPTPSLISRIVDRIYYLLCSPKQNTPDKGKIKKQPKKNILLEINDNFPSTPTPCKQDMQSSPRVFADYHTNSKVASSRQLPVCKGKAFPEVVNNGYQILDKNGEETNKFSEGITGFATKDRPKTGFISLTSPHYIEWQINTARAAGLDGFVVEWGYPNSKSSADKALKLMKSHLKKLPKGEEFSAVPVFIPTWYVNSWDSQDSNKKISYYRNKIHEALDNFYQDPYCPKMDNEPFLFLLNFYGAHDSGFILKPNELEQLLDSDPKLKNSRFAYRMAPQQHFWQVSKNIQIASDYQWLPSRPEDADSSNDSFIKSNFFKYGTHENIKNYQHKLNNLNENFKTMIPIKASLVTPGIDTRDAPWSQCNSYIPRTENGYDTFKYSWEQARKYKPNSVIVGTYNDYSEGTNIEPSTQNGYKNLEINAEQSCLLKGGSNSDCEKKPEEALDLAEQATALYEARIFADKIRMILPEHEKTLKLDRKIFSWSRSIFNKNLAKAKKRQLKVNRFIDKIPYKKQNLTYKDIPTRQVGKNQTKIKLTDLFESNYFINDNAFSEADIQIQISRRDKNAVSPVIIQSKLSSSTEVVGKFFLPSDLEVAKVRLPLNNYNGKLNGRLSRNYTINHEGFDVKVKEIRAQSYTR